MEVGYRRCGGCALKVAKGAVEVGLGCWLMGVWRLCVEGG